MDTEPVREHTIKEKYIANESQKNVAVCYISSDRYGMQKSLKKITESLTYMYMF